MEERERADHSHFGSFAEEHQDQWECSCHHLSSGIRLWPAQSYCPVLSYSVLWETVALYSGFQAVPWLTPLYKAAVGSTLSANAEVEWLHTVCDRHHHLHSTNPRKPLLSTSSCRSKWYTYGPPEGDRVQELATLASHQKSLGHDTRAGQLPHPDIPERGMPTTAIVRPPTCHQTI